MINKVDLIENGIICTGIGISLVDIQNILSIIILIIDIIWIIGKFTIKFFQHFRDGVDDEELDQMDQEVNDLKDDLNNIKDGDKK